MGIAVVPEALWLVSQSPPDPEARQRGTVSAGVRSYLVASLGPGVQFLVMAQAGSGLGPVVLSRVVSVAVLGAYGTGWTLTEGPWAATVATGAVSPLAIVLCLEATREQLMALATVLSASTPPSPSSSPMRSWRSA